MKGELARDATDHDLFGAPDDPAFSPPIEVWGTAGWEGEDVVEDLGDPTVNEGRTLARVTIYDGRPLNRRPQPGVAQGKPFLVQVVGPFFAIPPKGTQLMIRFPNGDMETPANGYIAHWAQNSPANTGGSLRADRAILDVGAGMDLVLKGRRVLVMDHTGDEDDGFSAWLCVGSPPGGGDAGIYASDGVGDGLTIAGNTAGIYIGDGDGGVLAAISLKGSGTSDPGAGIFYNGAGFLTVDASGAWDMVGRSFAAGCGTVTLGIGATPANPALWGFSGVSGVASSSVFISM